MFSIFRMTLCPGFTLQLKTISDQNILNRHLENDFKRNKSTLCHVAMETLFDDCIINDFFSSDTSDFFIYPIDSISWREKKKKKKKKRRKVFFRAACRNTSQKELYLSNLIIIFFRILILRHSLKNVLDIINNRLSGRKHHYQFFKQ